MIYTFSGVEVDTGQIELRGDGESIHIEPQVFDVLVHLIEHRERVVTKIELLDEIWGGAFVGESALTSRIKSARKLVGDSGRAQKVIRTIHGRGYQFVADVTVRTDNSTGGPGEPAPGGGDAAALPRMATFVAAELDQLSLPEIDDQNLGGATLDAFQELFRQSVEPNSGQVLVGGGARLTASFDRVVDAVGAVEALQRAAAEHAWPADVKPPIKLGIHLGEAYRRGPDFFGPAVDKAAQISAAAHGGQIIVSDAAAGLIQQNGVLTDLGLCQIDPAVPPLRLWQLGGPPFPPLAGSTVAPPPSLRTELIGRDQALEHVVNLATDERVVSIVGTGGAGKTTLAMATANVLLASFPGGVVFVELAAVGDAGGIARAIAETAGIDGAVSADPRSLARHMASRPLLLILDNCEHLLNECADFVDLVLDSGPTAHILTTTREPLGVDGEQVFPLASLAEHGPELFATRAKAVAPDVDIDVDDLVVVDLCHQLDGLPLAIELAAAQLRHLSLDDLAARLNHRLDLSRGGRSRGRERHETLDHTIAWSYELLDEHSQWLFRQLGIFPGSFDLDAVDAIASRQEEGAATDAPPVVRLISDLVLKNLLVTRPGSGRFRLLETIRAFANRRLVEAGESESAAERLRRHVVDRSCALSRTDRWLSGRNAATLRADLHNVRFAFEQSMWAGETTDALEILLAATYLFRNTMNCGDGRSWLSRFDDIAPELSPRDQLWLLLCRLDVAQGTADHRKSRTLSKEAVKLAAAADDNSRDAEAIVIALHFSALQHVVSAPEVAEAKLQEAKQLAASLDDGRLSQLLDAFSAMTALAEGGIERGTAMAERVATSVAGDGYEVYIAHWAAWTAGLIGGDVAKMRHWQEQQRQHLQSIDVAEPWLFWWSDGLLIGLEGGDPLRSLSVAFNRADTEGHDTANDTVLALAMIERSAGRPAVSAELLGAIRGKPLNNLSHYIVFRALSTALALDLGELELEGHMQAKTHTDPHELLDTWGLSLD